MPVMDRALLTETMGANELFPPTTYGHDDINDVYISISGQVQSGR